MRKYIKEYFNSNLIIDAGIENAEGKNALDDFVMAIINNFKNVIENGSEWKVIYHSFHHF